MKNVRTCPRMFGSAYADYISLRLRQEETQGFSFLRASVGKSTRTIRLLFQRKLKRYAKREIQSWINVGDVH